MSAVAFPRAGGSPSRVGSLPDGAPTGGSLRRHIASMLAMAVGLAGFAVTVGALRFALGQQTVVAPSLAMGISIASAAAAILAFWCASTLDARTAAEAAAR